MLVHINRNTFGCSIRYDRRAVSSRSTKRISDYRPPPPILSSQSCKITRLPMFRMSFPLFFFFPSFRNDAFVFSKQIRYSYVTQCNATRSDATSGSPLSLPDGAIHHPSMGIIRSAIKSLQKNRLLSSCCRSKIEMESGIIGTRGRFATGDDDGLYQAVHVGAASL